MKGKKGFTLVEIIAAMGLMALLIAMVMSVVLTGMKTVGTTVAINEKDNLATSIYKLMETSLRDAYQISDASITADPDDDSQRCLSVSDEGYLCLDGVEVYDRTHYGDGRFSYDLTISDGKARLKVTVGDYSVEGDFRIVNSTASADAHYSYSYGGSAESIYYIKTDGNAMMTLPGGAGSAVYDSSAAGYLSGWTRDSGTPGGVDVLRDSLPPTP